MINNFLKSLMGVPSIDPHTHMLATISIPNGGLGLQHPRTTAIPSLILSTKRAISYATKGIHLPLMPSAIELPASISSLYTNWHNPSPSQHVFQLFNIYAPSLASTIASNQYSTYDSIHPTDLQHFVHNTSLPYSREALKFHGGVEYVLDLARSAPDDVLHALPGLLLPHMSLPLIGLCRINSKNRMPNDKFTTALKNKLRVPHFTTDDAPICFCGQRVDVHMDHYFSCGDFKKNKCSHEMSDTTFKVMKRICPTAQYCCSKDDLDQEKTGLVAAARGKRPFDWSFKINHITASQQDR